MTGKLSIDRIKSLVTSHQNPLLALKAYAAFISDRFTEKDDLEYLVDHVLHCNAFALQAKQHIECVRDYIQIALDLLFHTLDFALEKNYFNTKTVELIVDNLKEGKLEGTRVQLRVLLYITLNNWACCEVKSGSTTLAYSLFSLCSIMCEMVRSDTLLLEEAGWNLVAVNNECVRQLMLCNFPEVEQLIVQELGLPSNAEHLHSSEHLAIPAAQDLLVGGQLYDATLLKGLICYAMAITQEFQHCEEAMKWYAVAIELLEQLAADIVKFDDLPDALKSITSIKDKLCVYVQETKQKMFEELDSRSENASRKRRKVASGLRLGAKRRKRTTQIDKNSIIVCAPAIHADLRSSIRRAGLATMILELSSVKEIFNILCAHSEGGMSPCVDTFISPLCDCAQSEGRVMGVLLCTETPVQRAIEQEKMLLENIRQPNSVWVLRSRVSDQSLEDQSIGISSKALSFHKEKFPKVALPPPMPLSAIEKSSNQLNVAVMLLDKRLNTLLKCEKAFEDQWAATEMIKRALMAFYVPQELLRLKADLLADQHLQALREERSARILTAFFRRASHSKQQLNSKCGERCIKSKEREAAITLQSYVRRWIAIQIRKELELRRKWMILAIIRVQSLFRGRKARKMYPELLREKQIAKSVSQKLAALHFAATQIQRVYRGHSTRLAVWRYLGQHHYATLHHLRDSRECYATVIQSRVRGMLVRKKYGKLVYAKRFLGRNRYRAALLERSCTVIQRCFREYRTRRRFIDRFRPLSDVGQETPLMVDHSGHSVEEETQNRFDAAAAIIQRSWRLHQARKLVRAMMEKRRIATFSRQKEMYKPFLIDEWVF